MSFKETSAAKKPANHVGTMGKGVFSKETLRGVNFKETESVEFVGRGIAALLADGRPPLAVPGRAPYPPAPPPLLPPISKRGVAEPLRP